MAVFKCKMCGGTIEFEQGAAVGVCDSCGTKQTLPRLDDDKRANLYDRANHFRRNNEFDKASAIYEQILNEDSTDAEAYWSLVLCQYGIEYVEDPATHKRVPTVNRAQFTSIFDDDNYKSALQHADGSQRELYEAEAKEINDIQKGILAISQKEEPFDVFICYKETDQNGRRTQDSVLANDLYHQLTQEGFKVFFARITLEDKLGSAYEPYIFAALNSSKVMVVLGTKPEYFNAVWVKNEWSRYLALVKKSGGKKILIPAYKDMDPYDLPEEFSHLQAQDMAKLGFMQDLIRGIKKISKADEPKQTVIETGNRANVAPLLERVFLFLEDGMWQDANTYCEKVLDIDPKNAEAYLGKLMAELQVKSRQQLTDCAEPFDGRDSFKKVIRFGDEKLEAELHGYINQINERNENARLTGIYDNAVAAMNAAGKESAFKAAAETFQTIPGFKDADDLAAQCLEKAENCRKNSLYDSAIRQMDKSTIAGYESAIKIFSTIPGWKDADKQVSDCQKLIENKKYQEEQRRIREGKAEKRRKAITAIIAAVVVIGIAVAIIVPTVIMPSNTYNAAVELYNEGKYEEAKAAFAELNGFKDSEEQITKCETALKDAKYSAAVDLFNDGEYYSAIAAFTELKGYKDSSEKIAECEAALKEEKYNAAVELYNEEKYSEAISAFKALNGYKDSLAMIEECERAVEYSFAVSLIEQKEYINAYESLVALNGYKDSAQKADEIYSQYRISEIKAAVVGDRVLLGSYEQDNDTSNGKEEIEWIVLAKENNKTLVISRYALDCQQYNTSNTSVTWETCSLRGWLNETFLNEAFNSEEQDAIINSTVVAHANPSYSTSPGNNTTDKVFLLSITEINKYYFTADSEFICQGTAYCNAQGAFETNNGNCFWWLRAPGSSPDSAALIIGDGSVYSSGYPVNYDIIAVRPAFWISSPKS